MKEGKESRDKAHGVISSLSHTWSPSLTWWREGRWRTLSCGSCTTSLRCLGGSPCRLGVADQLHLSDLLLSNVVVVVRHEVAAHLGQRVGNARVCLGGGREGCDFHVQVLQQVHILGIPRGTELLFLSGVEGLVVVVVMVVFC
ncbi:hypothetical protein E2C01_083279 [Portunus trituberculatus]|uniref:Uncharacterized protein n=1 Tax=Portunus trituberculatus TaxID=210409 RepID=A0A5B7J611_PORTR|nr:hypothetical protein [Portunus trituberculatus]